MLTCKPHMMPDLDVAAQVTVTVSHGSSNRDRRTVRSRLAEDREVWWVTNERSNVPDGCVHIEPYQAFLDGTFELLDDPEVSARTTVVVDVDGFANFDASERAWVGVHTSDVQCVHITPA